MILILYVENILSL